MKKWVKNILLSPLYACLLVACAKAQLFPGRLHFENLSVQNGLQSNAIQAIVQDPEGFLWIGTENGLHQYDGYTFKKFSNNENDTTTLQDNCINGLLEDKANNLWIATYMGLDLFDKKTNAFVHFPMVLENEVGGKIEKNVVKKYYINSIFRDSQDNIYVGTRGKDIYILDKTRKCVRYFDRNLNVPENQIRAEDNLGNLYLSTFKGAYKLDVHKRKIEEIVLYDDSHKKLSYESYFIFITSNSDQWIATNYGLFKIDHKTFKITRFEQNSQDCHSIPTYFISSIYEDKFQNTWFCSTKGLFTYNPKNNTFTTYSSSTSDGLSSNKIKCVYVDKSGILWVGNYNKGIDYTPLNNSSDFQIKRFADSKNAELSFFYKDKKQNIWVATNGNGLKQFDKNFNLQKSFTDGQGTTGGIGTNTVLSIFEDSSGDLWMGGFYGGLNKYNAKGKFEKYNLGVFYPPALKHLTNEIKDIIEDANQNLVIATNGAGILSFNKVRKEGTYYTESVHPGKGISSNWCTSLCKDKEGFIWIGSYYGLCQWDTKKNVFKSYFHTDKDSMSLGSNVVYTMYNDNENNLWVGTSKGLCLFQPKTNNFKVYKQKDGLPDNYIANIVKDDEGNIWMSTYSGISQFNVKNSKFVNYTYEDGLSGSLFVNNSCFKDKDGVLYFPESDGLIYFNPKHISGQKRKLSVYVTEFRLFDNVVLAGAADSPLKENIIDTKEITLPHTKSFISFCYTGINYMISKRIKYAYKLEGFDADWHTVGAERKATYSNLDPGTYTFNVRATAQDGKWYYPNHAIRLTIKPPFWKTGLAYSLYSLVALFIAYSIVKFLKFKYRLRQEVEQERLKAEQGQQLHDLKIRFFTNTSHDLRTPLTLMISPLEDMLTWESVQGELKRQLSLVFKNTTRLYLLVNKLMDFSKLESTENNALNILTEPGDLVKFSREVFEMFSGEAQRKQIDYRFITGADSIEAWFDCDKMERIIINLLSNAFKYTSDQGQVKIEIKVSNIENVCLSVIDNGSGIAEEHIDKIFDRYFQSPEVESKQQTGSGIGLALVKNLVELHHGTVSVTSEKWVRTCFTVTLPIGKTNFKESEVLHEYRGENWQAMPLNGHNGANIPGVGKVPVVLVVEDNLELRSYVCSVLKNDYTILEASDGLEGFQLAKKEVPDLIVSDILMPYMSGTEMCEKLKKELSTSHIPVLLLTAKASLDDTIEGLEMGADAYITKPFSVKLLRVNIKKLIKTRRALFQRFSQEAYIIPNEISNNPVDQKFLQRVIDYIEENMDNSNLTVEGITEHTFLSQSQTYRKIKALTGQHINEFVRTIRLKKAVKLFDAGEDNVSEVAFKVGFSSPAYFTKCFREQFNLTPTEFIRKNRK